MHVAIFVYCDDVLAEHHLAHPPEPMHHFKSLIGVLLPDAHKNQIVKHPFGRQRYVHNLRKIHLEDRQKNSNRRVADVEIFHWRFTDDCCRINRIPTVRDRRQMENGVVFDCSVKSGMVAKGPFRAHVARLHIAF